jgi:D-amino-acid oxidase
MSDVVVIGCGVIGLSTGLRLREAGLDARIVSAAPPEETTSAVAAAIWYPYKAYPERDVLRWGRHTFRVFEELAAEPETGVRMREGLELRRERAGEPWWAGAVPGVRRCTEDELPPGYRDGHAFIVPVVEMPSTCAICGTASPPLAGRWSDASWPMWTSWRARPRWS